MRSRRKSYTDQVLASSSYRLNLPIDFSKIDKEIILEIGCGRGDFIIKKALANPDTFFIALEKDPSITAQALKKAEEYSLGNLKFIFANADKLLEIFPSASVKMIILNFSDPWPKKRHHKRRLSASVLLSKYQEVLKDSGTIRFRTDNKTLYLDSLDCFKQQFTINYAGIADMPEDNIISEYETRFRNNGQVIYQILAQKK